MDFVYETELRRRYDRHYEAIGKKTPAMFEALREAIVAGAIPGGARLPSTREMAAGYGLSRGSVNIAYEMLAAEGYVGARMGSGTYVTYAPAVLRVSGKRPDEAVPALTPWALRLSEVPGRRLEERSEIDLSPRLADTGLFPTDAWKRVMYEEVRQFAGRQYEDAFVPEGHQMLREAIARHVVRERGIAAGPEQVVITNGSMQAIALLCMLLVREGDPVVVENPSYGGIVRGVQTAGGLPVPAKTDLEGIVPQDWDARLLFVTPARQFPTGAVLSPSRRKRLIEWASEREAYVVEDDYDSEFRWGGRPVEPLKSLDREGRVVYLGSFSKTIASDLRIGYAVVPQALAEPFRRAKYWIEPHPSAIMEQRALARFMSEGGYARHLRVMQRTIGRRLAAFRHDLQEEVGDCFELYPSDAGLQLFARWRGEPEGYLRLKRNASALGVTWADGSDFWWDGAGPASALFGFAHLPEATLAEAVRRIRSALGKQAREWRKTP